MPPLNFGGGGRLDVGGKLCPGTGAGRTAGAAAGFTLAPGRTLTAGTVGGEGVGRAAAPPTGEVERKPALGSACGVVQVVSPVELLW